MAGPRKRARSEADEPGLKFFRPESADDIARALAWVDAQCAADVSPEGRAGGDPWSILTLSSARLHPCAPELVAAAVGTPARAIRAVLEELAFVDDDGLLRLWPWYPEEDAAIRPPAEREALALGLALPRECLDEPFEPAHYLRRANRAALDRWLAARGVDVSGLQIERVPIPPRGAFPDARFEGGMSASAPARQAFDSLRNTQRRFDYIGDDAEAHAQLEAWLDRDLARICRCLGSLEAAAPPPPPPSPIAVPSEHAQVRPVGLVQTVFALPSGALLVTDGALVSIDRDGAFLGAWPYPYGEIFAKDHFVIINHEYVLDLADKRFIDGDLRTVLDRIGLESTPSSAGHDERTESVISACGRYLLDVDESPYIIRLSDGLTVAEHNELEKILEPGKRRPGLVREEDVAVAEPVVIDGVRFTLRSGEPPMRHGRSLEFALAGDRWRFLVGDVVYERGKVIARLGIAVSGGAFRHDGAELWALGSDHAIRLTLEPAPAVGCIVPLEPILRDAERALGQGGHDG